MVGNGTQEKGVQVVKVEELPPPKKLKFKSVKVPYYLHDRIKELAQRYNRKMYAIVADALSIYENYLKKPYRKSELPRLDKASWYVFKLGRSVGAFKENPTKENGEKLLNTLDQIEERLGVKTDLLRGIIKKLINKPKIRIDTDTSIEINDATKLIIADILNKLLFKEEEEESET